MSRAVAVALLATGLPAYAVLMGVSGLFATVGVLAGGIEYPLLTALPGRIIGLLETDLLQALPLYVFMGALLNRLPLADRLFRCGVALGGHSGGAPAPAPPGPGGPPGPLHGPGGPHPRPPSLKVPPPRTPPAGPPPPGPAARCVAPPPPAALPP